MTQAIDDQRDTDTSGRPAHAVFVMVKGQDDNMGDSVLRRAFLDALRPGARLHVLADTVSDGFISGLGASRADILYRDPRVWHDALRDAMRAGHGTYAFKPGELDLDWRQVIRLTPRRALRVAELRRHGWSTVQVGNGMRHPERRANHLLAPVFGLHSLTTWRDADSRDAAHVGRVAPDWGFAVGASTVELDAEADAGREARRLLALTFRNDGPGPSDASVELLRGVAAAWDLDIVAVAQAARDSVRAEELARRLGGDAVTWTSDRHDQYESTARSIYRRSRFVVGDRLHGLIIGMTEGATPVGLVASGSSKIQRTFDAVGLPDMVHHVGSAHAAEPRSLFERLDRRWPVTLAALGDARRQLDLLATCIQSLGHRTPVALVELDGNGR